MKIDINNSFLPKDTVLNNPNSSTDTITNLDIDSAEKKINAINQDDSLISVLEKQREAVRTVSPRNTETDISNALLDSIDQAALELELLNAWTEGGLNVIAPMLDMMLTQITSDGVIEGTEIEDTIQIILIDLMVRGQLDNSNLSQDEIAWITEFIGSGAHKDRVQGNVTQEQLASAMKKVYNLGLLQDNSVALKAALALKNNLGEDNVLNKIDQIMDSQNYWTDKDGFYLGNDGYSQRDEMGDPECTKLSPVLRLMLLSIAAKNDNKLQPEDWDKILTSNPKEIELILGDNLFDFIVEKSGDQKWHIFNPYEDGGAHFGQNKWWLDYKGTGIDLSYLSQIFNKFPSRVLTDDELKKINRIGDNVKMIMQTLKYWFQILRDERVAIARNI
ncbi:TPA: molecular chaperone [Vibrio cholerae]|nr:molecular chaperone [Vibrio cholerae]EGQ9647581.1 molecular chaperone [Vibrio cholerae]EJL6640846.1 molecular chaperone [Vibrio cholerae]HEJ2473408.1 molecular chaperone [Vibrio cholerae]HEK4033467.1 molecular chaperone [Vibrio cholerae]